MEKISRTDAKAKGLKKYFTGKPCPHGHIVERYVSSWQCVTCAIEYCKFWQPAHRERMNEWRKEWRAANPDKQYKMWRNNYIKNKERRHSNARNRNAKIRDAVGTHTAKDIKLILQNQDNKCANCFIYLDKYHVDHIMPISKGGSNWPSNLQCLCPLCNTRKSDLLPEEWEKIRSIK